jgi:DNA polymerase-1
VTEVLRAAAGKLVAFDANTLHHFAQTLGLPEVAIERDLQLLSYAIDPGKYKHTLANVAIDLLSLNAAPPKALGDGDGAYSAAAALPDACALMATELSAMRQLEPVLVKAAQEARVWELVQTLELPLTGVLAAMERRGVAIDTRALGDMSEKIEASLSALEREIFAAAGGEFAIGSPKQLAEILFGKLGLAAGKRTKSGPSTDSSVLEALRDEHPIVGAVLEWRGLSKLRGTYVDALPKLVHPVSGRIHTHFSQVTAATGRLSSSEPNLQAIPVRGPLGRAMRAAFVAAPGMSLVSADYSQIELRLLAHLAHSASLIKAFQAGVDVHKATAAEIFGVPLDQVSPEMRRRAKTVNFGVLYGMGPVRLARDLSISRGEASAFIERYFERFPEIRAYMDRCTEEARSTGEVRTLLGRRRRLADITSSNRQAAAAAERMATNTPVQGSAADIVKVAMLRVHSALQERFPAAGLVAQVHDELLVECLAEQAEAVSALMRDLMEHVVTLEVPLEVNCGSGANWDEAH